MSADDRPSTEPPLEPGLLTRLPAALRWLVLLLLSVVLAAALEQGGIPGALLLGPMLAAIAAATNGARLSVPRLPYFAAHSMIGCVIARALDMKIAETFLHGWPLFLSVVLAIVLASTVMGYLMARSRILPGTTAIWGTSAGAASAMMLMAEAYGADARLVAFMQYLRVVCVASAASVIAALAFHAAGGEAQPVDWFRAVDVFALLETLAVAFAASAAGALLRIPAGTMLLPMIATAALSTTGYLQIELPPWLLAISYAALGWKIGLGFTRRILRHATSALPQIMLSIVVLMAFCAGLAVVLWATLGVDLLTAYLATSPGGLDSVAIIAASTPVDIAFVMALQTARLFIIILIGPSIARMVARRLKT